MSGFLRTAVRPSSYGGGRPDPAVRRGPLKEATKGRTMQNDNSGRFATERSMSFRRIGRLNSRQKSTGSQIMLQKVSNQNVQQEVVSKEKESFGDYTLDEIMEDLVILQEQQREAQNKLECARATKQKKLEKQQQLNTLLEEKNFSNGARRAKLVQSREFLSVATRDLGNRKLVTEKLHDAIASFESKVKEGIRSTKMIEICDAKIDSFLLRAGHKVSNISRLQRAATIANQRSRAKYDQTIQIERKMQIAIQRAHKKAHYLAGRKKNLQHVVQSRKSYKLNSLNKEQSIELSIKGLNAQIAAEDSRDFTTRAELSAETRNAGKLQGNISREIDEGCSLVQKLISSVKVENKKIETIYGSLQNIFDATDEKPSLVVMKSILCNASALFEAEKTKIEKERISIEKSIEQIEDLIQDVGGQINAIECEMSNIVSSTDSIVTKERNSQQEVEDYQKKLEAARIEVKELERNFGEIQNKRKSGVSSYSKKSFNLNDQIEKETKIVERLKAAISAEEISLKTKVRLFEANQKSVLTAKLEEALQGCKSAEEGYHNMQLNITSNVSTEAELEIELSKEYSDEIQSLNAQNKIVLDKCQAYVRKYPELQEVSWEYRDGIGTRRQLDTVLMKIEEYCNARKDSATKMKQQRAKQKRFRQDQLDDIGPHMKSKDEISGRIKRRRFQNKSYGNDRCSSFLESVSGARNEGVRKSSPCRKNAIPRPRRLRRRKGSDFFNPKAEDNGKMDDDDDTPTRPRELISAFSSQSSGNRVRWIDEAPISIAPIRLTREEKKTPMNSITNSTNGSHSSAKRCSREKMEVRLREESDTFGSSEHDINILEAKTLVHKRANYVNATKYPELQLNDIQKSADQSNFTIHSLRKEERKMSEEKINEERHGNYRKHLQTRVANFALMESNSNDESNSDQYSSAAAVHSKNPREPEKCFPLAQNVDKALHVEKKKMSSRRIGKTRKMFPSAKIAKDEAPKARRTSAASRNLVDATQQKPKLPVKKQSLKGGSKPSGGGVQGSSCTEEISSKVKKQASQRKVLSIARPRTTEDGRLRNKCEGKESLVFGENIRSKQNSKVELARSKEGLENRKRQKTRGSDTATAKTKATVYSRRRKKRNKQVSGTKIAGDDLSCNIEFR